MIDTVIIVFILALLLMVIGTMVPKAKTGRQRVVAKSSVDKLAEWVVGKLSMNKIFKGVYES